MVFIIVILLLLSLSSVAFAGVKPFRFGARVGVNSASTSEDVENLDKKRRNGFGVGLFFDYYFIPVVVVQVNAIYNQKGVKFEGGESGQGFSYTFKSTEKLAYLSIPVLVRYALSRGKGIVPFITAGPELGILLSAKVKSETSGDFVEAGESEDDIKDNLKSTEFAVNFGGGVEIPLQAIIIIVDLRYALGLTKIHKSDEFDAKNNVISLNVAVALP
jgi:hypothetical protein